MCLVETCAETLDPILRRVFHIFTHAAHTVRLDGKVQVDGSLRDRPAAYAVAAVSTWQGAVADFRRPAEV